MKRYSPSRQDPWNEHKCQHLLRRCGFGASKDMVTETLKLEPSEAVAQLVDRAQNGPAAEPPFWKDLVKPTDVDERSEYRSNLRGWYQDFQLDWMIEMHHAGA
jgi:hypothetical protein